MIGRRGLVLLPSRFRGYVRCATQQFSVPTRLCLVSKFQLTRVLPTTGTCGDAMLPTSSGGSSAGRKAEQQMAKRGLKWKPTDVGELRTYLTSIIFMGLVKVPRRRDYWRKANNLWNNTAISNLMSKTRWQQLTSAIHLVDNPAVQEDRPESTQVQPEANADDMVQESNKGCEKKQKKLVDKMQKCRWFIEEVNANCKRLKAYAPNLTVDEMMVLCKSKYATCKAYMAKKPVKHGLKFWMLCDADSKYCYSFELYMGKDENEVLPKGSGAAVTEKLTKDLDPAAGHHVFMDNFFTGPQLLMDLLQRGVYATGTCRSDRKGWPRSSGFAREADARHKRGEVGWRMHRPLKICAVSWYDRKFVNLLSTGVSPVGSEDCHSMRWHGNKRVALASSPLAVAYSKKMRGVDTFDQMLGNYSVQLRSHKWWQRIFMAAIDVSLTNAYILYRDSEVARGVPENKRTAHKMFLEQVGRGLRARAGESATSGTKKTPEATTQASHYVSKAVSTSGKVFVVWK